MAEHAGRALGFLSDPQWVERRIAGLPCVWQDVIRRRWTGSWSMHEPLRQRANLDVLATVGQLEDAQRAGLRADANDDDIRQRARVFARHYQDGTERQALPVAVAWCLSQLDRHGMWVFWPGWKPGKPGQVDPKRSEAACVARVRCESFWRRTLRRMFAKTIERCSIGLGMVNKARQCYVSDLSAKRRSQQVARNHAAMAATVLENEFGQRMSVDELAGKSTANKTIRRAELMTRISGFDAIALDLGHAATFLTVTCPSAMHKWTDRGHGVVPNTRYDGTLPDAAQKYLSSQWALCRSWLARRGVALYGFRVAEPHHDGCPHWHFLLFHAPEHLEQIREGFRAYFLDNRDPNERGAAQHRVKVEAIDRAKGSAASYLAKYIAKSIDGYGVGEDLFGAPAVESSRRVDAWASTWRIRQFQQVGGPPVTVWRELRRINPEELPADLLPRELSDALSAVNLRDTEPEAKWAQGWASYVRAMGGPCVKRARHAIKLLRMATGEFSRYGEDKAADVVGVACAGRNWHTPAHMAAMFAGREHLAPLVPRPAAAYVESERCSWVLVGAGESLPRGEAGRPWTRVNNCTRTTMDTGQGVRDVIHVQRGKLGRFRTRQRAGGPQEGLGDESMASA